ncbi:MAG: DUF393 domain-containing protein [Planctomycetota bacterium]
MDTDATLTEPRERTGEATAKAPASGAAEPVRGPALPPRSPAWSVEVFFDGDCPLCLREINMLRRMDKAEKIRFTDIAAEGFDTAAVGIDMPTLMAEIHGRLPTGEIITGVEVFRRLYSAVGLGWAVAPTRWPGVRQVLDIAYRFFAKYRLRLTGRCGPDSAACKVPGNG